MVNKKTVPKKKAKSKKKAEEVSFLKCKNCKRLKTLCICGRPAKIDDTLISKLEYAFSMGCTDLEACLFAEISHQTLYEFQKKNPGFTERKKMLKQRPILKARTTVNDDLIRPETARWFLERKKKAEFSTRSIITSESLGGEMTDEHRKKVEKILKMDGEDFDEDTLEEDDSDGEDGEADE